MTIHDLFHKWGTCPSKQQLHVKLLVLLCLLGVFCVLATALPYFDAVDWMLTDQSLVVLVVGYKND